MRAFETITCDLQGAVASVTLNRPESRNAMSHQMVEELLSCFHELADDSLYGAIRVVVVRAAGTVFSAGGDVRDLAAVQSPEKSRAAVARLDELLAGVNEAPQVIIARVQGAVRGGGLGLVCVSDIAIASNSATFALPEVRLGLVPAIISPYVIARVGLPRARQLMLGGQEIGAAAAAQYGLVHMTTADEELDQVVESITTEVLKGAPEALRACKRLLLGSTGQTLDARVDLLNELRSSREAQAGMLAFLRKEPPPWTIQS
jgi:isohexenylglutaconyl-CoA hydratase